MARRYVLSSEAARRVAELIRGKGEVSRRPGAMSKLAFDADYVAPFTVQWAQSAADGSGSWIIWLPGDRLLMIGNNPVDVADDLSAVGGDYPEGWYLLPDEVLSGEDGGTLYLNIVVGPSQDMGATFDSEPTSTATDYINLRICKAEVDESGVRRVRQFVRSAIAFWPGVDENTDRYAADERSVTLLENESTDPTQIIYGNYFHIRGFGKFTPPNRAHAIGTYLAPTTSTINVGGDATSFAVLARVGNSSAPDSNSLVFVKLKVSGSGGEGSDADSAKRGCWRVGEGVLEDCYYNVGGVTKQAPSMAIPAGVASKFLCAVFSQGGGVVLRTYTTLGSLNTAQEDMSEYIVPLYKMNGDGDVELDMRTAPQIQIYEGTL